MIPQEDWFKYFDLEFKFTETAYIESTGESYRNDVIMPPLNCDSAKNFKKLNQDTGYILDGSLCPDLT